VLIGRLRAVRAARFVGPGQAIEIQDLPEPSPGPQDVVVKVEACGICASDLHFIRGEMPLPVAPPLTMGHEASGVVAAVGSDVQTIREGARVSVMGGKVCLRCPSCTAGMIEDCQDAQIMGVHYDGAWAEHVLVPWYALAPIPEGVTFEHAAIACDAVATPYAALTRRGALRPGERVGIWGIGGLGTHAVQVARLAGASFVVALDPLPAARDRALAVGADLALDPLTEDVAGAVRDATGGLGLDLAVDAVGSPDAIRQAVFCMVRGGRIVLMGQTFQTLDAGPIVLLSFLRIALLGHLGYSKKDLVDVLDLIASGRLDLTASVSDRLPLERVNEGIRRLTSKEDAPVRLVVLPQV
jgi:2-desacetyl-2-hydroxyethyl bacteriochlorophyllide A dehydrogenase